MIPRPVTILDRERNVVATADVEFLGGRYSGQVDADRMSHPHRLLFEEYEEIVNDQIFSLLDQIEGQIDASSFSAVFANGREAPVEDLQIFPKGGTMTFKVAQPVDVHRD